MNSQRHFLPVTFPSCPSLSLVHFTPHSDRKQQKGLRKQVSVQENLFHTLSLFLSNITVTTYSRIKNVELHRHHLLAVAFSLISTGQTFLMFRNVTVTVGGSGGCVKGFAIFSPVSLEMKIPEDMMSQKFTSHDVERIPYFHPFSVYPAVKRVENRSSASHSQSMKEHSLRYIPFR